MYNQFELIPGNLESAMTKAYSMLRLSPAANVAAPLTDSQRAYAQAWANKNQIPLDDDLTLTGHESAFADFLQAVQQKAVANGAFLVIDGIDEHARKEPFAAQSELWEIIKAGVTVVIAANGRIFSMESVKESPTDLIHSLMYMIDASTTPSSSGGKAVTKKSTALKIAPAPTGKVYSYMRFSAMAQKTGTSIARQSHYAEVYAKEHGMVLDSDLTLIDEGKSAYHQRHVKKGAFGGFLRAVESGKVPPGSVLIVEGFDRLSRAAALTAQGQLATIINAGITVVTAADNKVYSQKSLEEHPEDLIFSLIVMIRAHEESEWKSRRAKQANEKLCQAWINGTKKGRIGTGRDPAWIKWNNGVCEIIEPEAARVRRIIDLYLQGYGTYRIKKILESEGNAGNYHYAKNYVAINLMIKNRAHLFIGTRIIETGGVEYCLENYYPPIIDRDKYNALIAGLRGPKRTGRESPKPSIFTGSNGLFRCGYCGRAMGADSVSQTFKDGKGVPKYKSYRRTRCDNPECRTGSAMVQPLEKAVIEFCSNQMNLNSLIGRNMSDEIRSRLAASRAALPEQEKRLQRIMDAMFSTDDPPASFAQQARMIEKEIARLNHAIKTDEAALLAEANTPTREAASIWATLAKGVEDDDVDARIAVRKLVVDTFEKIVFYRHGINPPPVEQIKHQKDKEWQLLLVSKSGVSRFLRISRDGRLLGLFDLPREAVA
jgi:DNA invertase Pin-like site-specific DNA recombinase